MAALPAASPRESATPPALGGRLSAVSLFDLCQFLLLNRRTGNLTLRSGGSVAYFVFSDGQITAATDDTFREGEPVVHRALQWTEGVFDFAPGPVSPVRKIQSSTDSLLLEAARQIDEMAAATSAATPAGGRETSAEAAFREKQQRGASLTEAFRSAVAAGETARRGQSWKDECLRALAEPGATRLLLGPGPTAAVIEPPGVRSIPGVSAAEFAAWIEEIAPPPANGKRGSAIPIRHQTAGGKILWSVRHASPEGEWLSVSLARSSLPEWSELGLPDAQFARLEDESGITLLFSTAAGAALSAAWPGSAALAAWLKRRSTERAESAWIVETLPLFDWTLLPGRVRSVAPARLCRPGALETLRSASDATLIVLAEITDVVLRSALHLAAEGVRVVVAGAGSDPAAWTRAADQRLAALGLPTRSFSERVTTIWSVRSGSPPGWLPFTTRLDAQRSEQSGGGPPER